MFVCVQLCVVYLCLHVCVHCMGVGVHICLCECLCECCVWGCRIKDPPLISCSIKHYNIVILYEHGPVNINLGTTSVRRDVRRLGGLKGQYVFF